MSYYIDQEKKPAAAVWVNPFDNATFINVCNKACGCAKEYGHGACNCGITITVKNHETLVALYNALHEALFVHELEPK